MGSKGGSAPSKTTQTVINDVPAYAKPYLERNLARAEAVTNTPYAPYQYQRLADFNSDTLASQGMVRDLANQGTPQVDQAIGIMGGLGSQAAALGNRPGAEFSQFGGANAYAFDPTRQFTGDEVSRYMSPYMDEVVQRQQADALRQFDQMRGTRDARAIGAGAFGGSRQAIQEGMAEETVARQMGDISATGRQRAFEAAAQMFGADRAAQMERERMAAGEQARVQGIEAQDFARVQQGQADENMRRDQFGLSTLGFQADTASQLAALGEQARAGNIQAAQLLERIGMQQMSQQQAGLDIGYQDFLRQQQYPMQQTAFMADLIRGLPIAGTGTQTTQQPYNPLQEMLGLGISGVGLYNALRT
jgi:hypothetical protein